MFPVLFSKSLVPLTMLIFYLLSTMFSPSTNVTITEWDGMSQYKGTINNRTFTLYLVDDEVDANKPVPGKIKIVFKDSKQQGTTFIYERDMKDGEISDTDKVYIEKVLESVKEFHRDNHTLNGKIMERVNAFFKSIKKKR